jgi:hypothetical protein
MPREIEPRVIDITDLQNDLSGLDFVAHVNRPPDAASKPAPANIAVNIALNANLSWTGSDPDVGDNLLYDVYFGTISNPVLVSADQADTSFDTGILNPNTVYYWKIVTKDNYGMTTPGPVWHFTTLNRSPLPPSTPLPQNAAIDVDVDTALSWTGGDPDTGDTVVYDVYFGTEEEPELLITGQTELTLDPGDLIVN